MTLKPKFKGKQLCVNCSTMNHSQLRTLLLSLVPLSLPSLSLPAICNFQSTPGLLSHQLIMPWSPHLSSQALYLLLTVFMIKSNLFSKAHKPLHVFSSAHLFPQPTFTSALPSHTTLHLYKVLNVYSLRAEIHDSWAREYLIDRRYSINVYKWRNERN